MEEFAKLYTVKHPKTGADHQLLVTKETDEEGKPQLTFNFVIEEGVRVTPSFGWHDTEQGWKDRDETFNITDQENAQNTFDKQVEYLDKMMSQNG